MDIREVGQRSKGFDPLFDDEAGRSTERKRVVVVAGGAGFLGSNLCIRLIHEGDRVVCVDNLETGRLENLSEVIAHPDFRFFHHDILKRFSIKGPVNRIYNLACPASPVSYQKDPVHTFLTSVLGSLNLLEMAEVKSARVLLSSTSEVYGDPDVTPQDESYRGLVNTVGPRACYDEGKRAAETLFFEMHETRDVDVRIARIFNTYGPRMDPEDGRVISNFVVQALQGRDLTIYGNGEQTRSFCFLSDMLDALTLLMECEDCGSGPINLGNPQEFTINEIAAIVRAKVPAAANVVYRDLPKDDPHQRRPDISRAKTLLGWEPQVDLDTGLDATISYFREELRNTQSYLSARVAAAGGS